MNGQFYWQSLLTDFFYNTASKNIASGKVLKLTAMIILKFWVLNSTFSTQIISV